MPMELRCKTCQAVLRFPETLAGKTIKCPKCQTMYQVPAAPIKKAQAAPPPVQGGVPRPQTPPPLAMPPAPAATSPVRPGPPPRSNTSAVSFEAVPASKRNRSAKRGAFPWMWVGIGAGAFALLVALVVTLILAMRSPEMPEVANVRDALAKPSDPAPVVAAPPVAPPVSQPPVAPPIPNPPVTPPPVAPPTKEPLPKTMDRDTILRVKQATTYLKVTTSDGQVSEGSGFFAVEPGIVVTNAHVLGMMRIDSPKPRVIDIVLNSGEPNEVRRTGQALGVDLETDLAVVKVDGDTSTLPRPLTMGSGADLIELQPVHIFGFPLGTQVGKNITVAASSISSLRRDPATRELSQIQVNGGLHPGNSGGPVVDTRGDVIGVAVSGIKGTQIQFAVPTDSIGGLMNGRVADVQAGEPFRDGPAIKLPLRLALFDPLKRLRSVQIESWIGDADRAPGETFKPGEGARTTTPVALKENIGSAEIERPLVQGGKSLWVQAVLTSQSGTTVRSIVAPVKVSGAPPLERKPALLRHDFGTLVERTLTLKSSARIKILEGGQLSIVSEIVEYSGLEILTASTPDTRVQLHPGKVQFSIDEDGKLVPPHVLAEQAVRSVTHNYTIGANGTVKSRGQPNLLDVLPPELRNDASVMFNDIANTYEATFLPLPNRETMPLETWEASLPLWMMAERKPEVVDLKVLCTFEGVRSENGKKLAHIRMEGKITGRDPRRPSRGLAVGSAWLDLDQGFVSQARVAVRSEVGAGQIKALHLIDFELARVPGNPHGFAKVKSGNPLVPPPPSGARLVGSTLVRFEVNTPTLKVKPGHRFNELNLAAVVGRTYRVETTVVAGTPDPYIIVGHPTAPTVIAQGANSVTFKAALPGDYPIVATSNTPNRLGSYQLKVFELNTDVAVRPEPPPVGKPPVAKPPIDSPTANKIPKPTPPKNFRAPPPRAAAPRIDKAIELDIHAVSLCYDPYKATLYATIASKDPAHPEKLLAIRPTTGEIIWSVQLPHKPSMMALAPTGKALWVAHESQGSVQRVDLLERKAGEPLPLPNAHRAESMAVLPGTTDTLAVALKSSSGPQHQGIVILDNGTPRPRKSGPNTGSNSIVVCPDDPVVLFGYNGETVEPGLRRYYVDGSGIQEDRVFKEVLRGFHYPIFYASGRIFSRSGEVLDARSLKSLGKIQSGEVHADISLNRMYVLAIAHSPGVGGNMNKHMATVFEYDYKTFALRATTTVPPVTAPPTAGVAITIKDGRRLLAPMGPLGCAVAIGPKIHILPFEK